MFKGPLSCTHVWCHKHTEWCEFTVCFMRKNALFFFNPTHIVCHKKGSLCLKYYTFPFKRSKSIIRIHLTATAILSHLLRIWHIIITGRGSSASSSPRPLIWEWAPDEGGENVYLRCNLKNNLLLERNTQICYYKPNDMFLQEPISTFFLHVKIFVTWGL